MSDFLIMTLGAVFEVYLSVKGMLSDQLLVQSYSDATRNYSGNRFTSALHQPSAVVRAIVEY